MWKTLWAEGLATYVSMVRNPPASMQNALIVPQDLVQRSTPLLPELAATLDPNLDRIDGKLFAKYFLYRGPEANPPSRVGYYIGALVAQRIAREHTLPEIAHLPPNRVRKELGEQLLEIGREKQR